MIKARRGMLQILSIVGISFMLISFPPTVLSFSTTTNVQIAARPELGGDNTLTARQMVMSMDNWTPLNDKLNKPVVRDDKGVQSKNEVDNVDDITWSLYSNLFFVTGGVFYLICTSWDYAMYMNHDPSEDVQSILNRENYTIYQALWFMGPFVYLLNSVIDVRWAVQSRERDDARRKHLESLLVDRRTAGSSCFGTSLCNGRKSLLRRIKRHIGHRRELGAAATFGIAAFLSVLGSICWIVSTNMGMGDDSTLGSAGYTLEGFSIHVYLVSAAFALWKFPGGGESPSTDTVESTNNGHIETTAWYSDVGSLETLGDVFFGLASLVDVFLQDSTLDDNVMWWPVLSAILWTLDALLYLRGDFVSLYLRANVSGEEQEEECASEVEMKNGNLLFV